MDFSKHDLINVENLIKALKKANFNLDGLEILAFAELFKWVNKLYIEIQQEVRVKEENIKSIQLMNESSKNNLEIPKNITKYKSTSRKHNKE